MPADYSEEEMYVLKQLISDACEAEEFFSLDELEEYSTKMRGEKNESN